MYLGLGLKIPFLLLEVMPWQEGGEGSWGDGCCLGLGSVGEGGGLLGGEGSGLGCTIREGAGLLGDGSAQ